MKARNNTTHWEKMISEDAMKYVTKEETRQDGPYEYGNKPKNGVKYTKKTCKELLTTPIA